VPHSGGGGWRLAESKDGLVAGEEDNGNAAAKALAQGRRGQLDAFVGDDLFNIEKRDVPGCRRLGVAVGGGELDGEPFADERGAGAGGGEKDEGHWGKAEGRKS
jgi:hypothetical protein